MCTEHMEWGTLKYSIATILDKIKEVSVINSNTQDTITFAAQ